MSGIATSEFLKQLKTLYPILPSSASLTEVTKVVESPWYIVTAVGFSASNHPEEVPCVLDFVLKELDALSASKEDKLRVVVRLREALFKGGMISGYSRGISALIALYEATPGELRDRSLVREIDNDNVSDLIERGDRLFKAMYGDTAESVQSLLEAIHPDMGWFSKNIAYGHVYGAPKALGQRDTSYVIVAALIAMDTPRQINWHLANCRRGGASFEKVCAVREIAVQVASACSVQWRAGVPEVQKDA